MNLTLRNTNWSPFSEFFGDVGNEWHPAWDVEEADGHYLLSLEVPGVPKEQIKLELKDNQLTIAGERRQQKFSRSFILPQGTDGEKIEANCRDGVLQVLVPKAESAKPREIKIKDEPGKGFFERLTA